jgi:hypothetical protein
VLGANPELLAHWAEHALDDSAAALLAQAFLLSVAKRSVARLSGPTPPEAAN